MRVFFGGKEDRSRRLVINVFVFQPSRLYGSNSSEVTTLFPLYYTTLSVWGNDWEENK